jgi:hypothetical protein
MDLRGTGLKVYGQTNFSEKSVWYDPEKPPEAPHGFDVKNAAMSIIKPVISIEDSFGNVVYQSGEWYPPSGQYWLMGFAAISVIGILVIASKIAGSGRG